MSSTRHTTRLHTRLRIQGSLCLPASLWAADAHGLEWLGLQVDAAAISLERTDSTSPQSCSVEVEISGRMLAQGAETLPRQVQFEATAFTCEGTLRLPGGTTRQVRLQGDSTLTHLQPVEEQESSTLRLRICIPRRYRHEPVISNLVSRYRLTVNILGAMLGPASLGDGWFDLELRGERLQVGLALQYLESLDLEIWPEPVSLAENW